MKNDFKKNIKHRLNTNKQIWDKIFNNLIIIIENVKYLAECFWSY